MVCLRTKSGTHSCPPPKRGAQQRFWSQKGAKNRPSESMKAHKSLSGVHRLGQKITNRPMLLQTKCHLDRISCNTHIISGRICPNSIPGGFYEGNQFLLASFSCSQTCLGDADRGDAPTRWYSQDPETKDLTSHTKWQSPTIGIPQEPRPARFVVCTKQGTWPIHSWRLNSRFRSKVDWLSHRLSGEAKAGVSELCSGVRGGGGFHLAVACQISQRMASPLRYVQG
jgi:hypothetical protein